MLAPTRAGVVVVAFLFGPFAAAWGQEQPVKSADKPREWFRLTADLEGRLRAVKPCVDAKESVELVVDVRNTARAEAFFDGGLDTVRLRVYQDGRQVRPFLARVFAPGETSAYSIHRQWVAGGQTTSFAVTVRRDDLNFYSAFTLYDLRPGTYEVRGIFRSPAGKLASPKVYSEVETNPVVIEITGKDRPEPPGGRVSPADLPVIPEATRWLSAELRRRAARDAAALLIAEFQKALDSVRGAQVEVTGDRQRSPYWKLVHSADVGCVRWAGDDKQTANIAGWFDYEKNLGVTLTGGKPAIQKAPLTWQRPSYWYEACAVALPLRPATYNAAHSFRNWLCRRDCDTLVLGVESAHYVLWIDLRTLAVLSVRNWYGGDAFHVKRPEAYHYVEGFPFPIPRRVVREWYGHREQAEPARTEVLHVEADLSRKPLERFRLPPLPSSP